MPKVQTITLTPKQILDVVRSQVAGPGAEISIRIELPTRKLGEAHTLEIDSKLVVLTIS